MKFVFTAGYFETMPLQQPREETKGLTGSLEEFSLTDIIQILSLGTKTAKIEITRGMEKGTLYLLHGQIMHASAGNLRGTEAFYELIRWTAGKFCIMHNQTTDETNVTVNTMRLLLEATELMDERKDSTTSDEEKISAN